MTTDILPIPAQPLIHPLVDHLLHIVDLITAVKKTRTRQHLVMLQKRCGSAIPAERVVAIVTRCLLAHIDGSPTFQSGNLYNEAVHSQDMLSAYDLLVRATPFIRYGYLYANNILLNTIKNAPDLHIVDIGIGSGAQWGLFFEALQKRSFRCPTIRLTGIDVPLPGSDTTARLRQVGISLSNQANSMGISFSYEPIATMAEHFDWSCLSRDTESILMINAAFSLHHVPVETQHNTIINPRDELIKKLFALQPTVLCLIEPVSNHNDLPLAQRIREVLNHYITVFAALETCLGPHHREREIIEQHFFGREIWNIIGSEGTDRVERHERPAAWHQRFRRAQFMPHYNPSLITQLHEELELTSPFTIGCTEEGMTVLQWNQTPVVAASAWIGHSGITETS